MLLAGCAHTAAPAPARAVVCSEGVANLGFVAGSSRLDRISTRSLVWVAEVNRNCEVRAMTATGLPEPSADNLGGRRAASALTALRRAGVPRPIFRLGDEEAQRSPMLVVDAAPRRP